MKIEKEIPGNVPIANIHNFCIMNGCNVEVRKGKAYLQILEVRQKNDLQKR